MKAFFCAVALLAIFVSNFTFAAHPGADLTFGDTGIASAPASNLDIPSISFNPATITRVAGNGGYWYAFTSTYSNYVLARFGPNGQLDSTFDNDGVLEASFTNAAVRSMAMGLDGNGKPLIAAGTNDPFSTILQLRRLTQSGLPDSTFGTNGYGSIAFPVNVTNNGTAPVVPTRVVPRNGGGAYVIMARSAVVAINDQGSVDTTFSTEGFFVASQTIIDHTGYQEIVLAVSADGIVYALRQTSTGPTVVRYLANGSLDQAYGGTVPAPSSAWFPNSIFLDDAQNLYITFNRDAGGGGLDLTICKMDPQGHPNSSFGTNGVITIPGRNYSHVYFYSGYRLADVGRDGTLLVVANVDVQSHTSPITIRLFDQAANPILTFGGKGASRLEQTPIDERDIYAVNTQFDDLNRVIVLGVGRNSSETIRAVRLNRSFLHVAALTDAKTSEYSYGTAKPQTNFQYGDNIRADAVLAGDSGQPEGLTRFDVGTWSCSGGSIPFASPLRAGCTVLADAIGTYSWKLTFLGDEIYGSVQVSGPDIIIDKRKLLPGFIFFDTSATVEDYTTASVRWYSLLPGPNSLAYPAGVTMFRLGNASCQVPLDGSQGGTCRTIPPQVGPVQWTVRYQNDPFYTSDEFTLGTTNVQPAVKSVSVSLFSGAAQLIIAGTDPNCGLKYWGSYDPIRNLTSLPRPKATSAARYGTISFVTVPGCAINTNLAVNVTYPFTLSPNAELWSYIAPNPGSSTRTWRQLPATINGNTISTTLADGSIFDSAEGTPGTVDASFVLYNPANGTTTLGSSANPSAISKPITFTASVLGISPTGTVNFRDETASIVGCSAQPVVSAKASCVTSALAQGNHNITAIYSGDGNNPIGTSDMLIQRILNRASNMSPILMLLSD